MTMDFTIWDENYDIINPEPSLQVLCGLYGVDYSELGDMYPDGYVIDGQGW